MRTNEYFSKRWDELKVENGIPIHLGYDATHPLRIHFGYNLDGNREFFLITKYLPLKTPTQGNSISVQFGKRNDGFKTLLLTLLKPEQNTVFAQLCWDLAESCRNCTDDRSGTERMLNRFLKWQRLLESGGDGLLSALAIKGLIGELVFMDRYSLSQYNPEVAIDGWTGPCAADRDFIYHDQWYEIKTIDPGASVIKISSIEQLDTADVGELVVLLVERTPSSSINNFTLNGLIEQIRTKLAGSQHALNEFEDKLLEVGYITKYEYGQDFYLLKGIRWFKVNHDFPRIRRNMLDPSIVKAQYELSISSITGWEMDK